MSSSSDKGGAGRFPDYFDCVAARNETGEGWCTTNKNFEDSYIKENYGMCRVLTELYEECVKSKGSEHDNCNFFRDKASLCLLYMDQSKKEFRKKYQGTWAAKYYPPIYERRVDPDECERIYNSYKECICEGHSYCSICPDDEPCFQ